MQEIEHLKYSHPYYAILRCTYLFLVLVTTHSKRSVSMDLCLVIAHLILDLFKRNWIKKNINIIYMGCPISNLFRYEGMKLEIRNFAHLLLIMYGGYVQEVISL